MQVSPYQHKTTIYSNRTTSSGDIERRFANAVSNINTR